MAELCSAAGVIFLIHNNDHGALVDLNRSFAQRHIRNSNEYVKRCSIALLIRELQIKTTMKFPYIPIGIDKNKVPQADEDTEELELSYTARENAKY